VAEKTQPEQPDQGRKAVFRIPGTAMLAILLLIVCVTPVALGGTPGLQALYVVPVALIVFVGRTRTVATAKGLQVRTMFTSRELSWSDLKGLALTPRAKVRAVLADDSQVPLPAVRTRHLPVLSLVSAGRVGDPTGLTDDMTETALGKDTEPDKESGETRETGPGKEEPASGE
jgi:hypothetical protein